MEQNLLHNSRLREIVGADGRGTLVSAGCPAGALPPVRSAGEISGLSWPPFIQLKEQNPPQLSLLYPLQQGTSLLWSYPGRQCWTLPWLLDWCPWDSVHPTQGLWCRCAQASMALDGARNIPYIPVFAMRRLSWVPPSWRVGKLVWYPSWLWRGFLGNKQPWHGDHLHSLAQVTLLKILC